MHPSCMIGTNTGEEHHFYVRKIKTLLQITQEKGRNQGVSADSFVGADGHMYRDRMSCNGAPDKKSIESGSGRDDYAGSLRADR